MITSEIIGKAKLMFDGEDFDGVISLLEPHKNEDRTALALYDCALAMCEFEKNNVTPEQLSYEGGNRLRGLSDDQVFYLSKLCFAKEIGYAIIEYDTEKHHEAALFGCLKDDISFLAGRTQDFDVFCNYMDAYHEIYRAYGYGKYFYEHLCILTDWNSKTAETILTYIVARFKNATKLSTEKEIYADYIRNVTTNIFPFENMPPFMGGRVVINDIKSKEAAEFWKGYFAMVKTVRQKELIPYQTAANDKNHWLNEYKSIPEYIKQSWMRVYNKAVSSEDVAKMMLATGCSHLSAPTVDSLKASIANAEKSYATTKPNPFALLANLFKK